MSNFTANPNDFFSGSGDSDVFTNITTLSPSPDTGLTQNDIASLIAAIVGVTIMCIFMIPIYCQWHEDCKKNGDDCCTFWKECGECCCYNIKRMFCLDRCARRIPMPTIITLNGVYST